MSYSIAHSKYQNIKIRSFKSFLDLFLICTFLSDKNLKNVSENSFSNFNYDDPRISKAIKAHQLSKDSDDFNGIKVSELDSIIIEWHKTNDVNLFKTAFLRDKIINETEFKAFYKDDDFDRECKYCKIKESEIKLLIKNGFIQTKRLRSRGKTMEIDQRNPNEGYKSGNIALCCYWCNNAKTDEFNAEEFKPIGELIGQTLRKRLTK